MMAGMPRPLRAHGLRGAIVLLQIIAAGTALPVATARAQRDPAQEAERARRLGGVPREISLAVTAVWNAPSTRRMRGDITLAANDTVRGDLAVLNGRARLAGVVTGQVVVLNGDAILVESGRIAGALTVIGGTVESPDRPGVGGDIRVWSARYRYREEADTLVAETEFFGRWSRWMLENERGGAQSDLFVTT
ncbi:MAG: hypothetical protein P3B76_08175, partial [Gemmatimonadota bacterium]|nr:hypothetical protein [Gemmatimonadota bacterium]MDQ8172646.1 hypothetical protein [Gemmatimonadota bacterium]